MSAILTVVGSADAFNSAGRGNACYLVEDAAGAFCVDFGPTALAGLKRIGFEPNDLDAVLLTHLHGDHFGGLQLLFIDAQYRSGRARPLVIAGPPGTRERVEGLYRLCYGSAAEKPRKFAVEYVELAAGVQAKVAGRPVRTYAAHHMPPEEGAMHLKVRCGRATLAFSGDTAWSPSLPRLARGADLLVCECTEERGDPGPHLAFEQLVPRLGELPARRIVLTHLGEAMRRRAERRPPPRVRFAEDGMRIKVADPVDAGARRSRR
jgi:ribonuclease BN (tRNA processing enzyme)